MTRRGRSESHRKGNSTGIPTRLGRDGLLVTVAGALVALSLVAMSAWDFHAERTPVGGEALIRLRPGEPFSVVARQLVDAGVARSALNLNLWAYLSGVDRQVRPGEYLLRSPVSPRAALEQLRSGAAGYRVLTIPEGSTLEDIAALYEAAGFGSAKAFLQASGEPALLEELGMPSTGLEGYLYPDTYHFVWADPPERMIRTMVRRFRLQTASLQADRERLGLSEHQLVTLASIIEKEAKRSEERPLISAVFHNRLRKGMRLQADPTAVYGLGRGIQPEPEHLRLKTPYNTYLNEGLPPGPICNPGLPALEAAARPAPVDYLFFVARGDGSHVFSHTLQEHTKHVRELSQAEAPAAVQERTKKPVPRAAREKGKRFRRGKKR